MAFILTANTIMALGKRIMNPHPCGGSLVWSSMMKTKEAFISYIREVRDLPNLNVIQLIVDLGIRDNKVAVYNLIKAVIMENE